MDVLPEAIGELVNLESLSIDDNVLESLPRTLGTCHKLKRLLAFSNKIVAMPLGALGGLSMLQELQLHHNCLKRLPDDVGLLSSLVVLDCSYNQITDLPDSFKDLHELRQLRLSFNQVDELTEEVVIGLTKLQCLHLDYNRLQEIPPALGRCLPHLNILDLNHNRLRNLPDIDGCFANSGQLETLRLAHNQLTSITDEIGQMTRLNTLDIEGNNLQSLPLEIGAMGGLGRDWHDRPIRSTNSKYFYTTDEPLHPSCHTPINCPVCLSMLKLQGNSLPTLPIEMACLRSLKGPCSAE